MFTLQSASGTAKKAPALAFTENPTFSEASYLGLYKSKRQLIPNEAIKRIRIQNHLVASIVRSRGSMLSLFGHLRKDRFDIGIEVIIKPDFLSVLTPEQYEKVIARVKKFEPSIGAVIQKD